jgi:hypothetical protein
VTTYKVITDPTPLYKYPSTSKEEIKPRLHPPAVVTLIESGTMAKVRDANGRAGYVEWKKILLVSTDPNPPPSYPKFCYVLHGFQLGEHKFKNDVDWYYPTDPKAEGYQAGNKGVTARPCATRLKDFRPTVMTKEIQEMHFRVLTATAEGMTDQELRNAFNSIWVNGRGYNDHGASDGTNFINKPNGSEPGFKMNHILGDCAFLEIIGHATTLGKVAGKNFGLGEPCWPIRMMNARHVDLTSTPERDKGLWHKATIAKRDGSIEPYGQLQGRDVWMPNIMPDSDINWIPCAWVQPLAEGEIAPDAYFPSVIQENLGVQTLHDVL